MYDSEDKPTFYHEFHIFRPIRFLSSYCTKNQNVRKVSTKKEEEKERFIGIVNIDLKLI